jgi:hypothetical protein
MLQWICWSGNFVHITYVYPNYLIIWIKRNMYLPRGVDKQGYAGIDFSTVQWIKTGSWYTVPKRKITHVLCVCTIHTHCTHCTMCMSYVYSIWWQYAQICFIYIKREKTLCYRYVSRTNQLSVQYQQTQEKWVTLCLWSKYVTRPKWVQRHKIYHSYVSQIIIDAPIPAHT